MAIYEILPIDQQDKDYLPCLMRPQSFWESIKIAWKIIRYPDQTALYVKVDVEWCQKNLKPLKNED